MKKNVPFDRFYKDAKPFLKASDILLYVSMGLSLLVSLSEHYSYLKDRIEESLSILNAIVIIVFLVVDMMANMFYSVAETKRRVDFIDKSFGTSFSGLPSNGYFSNDALKFGVVKMAVNNFENSLFSEAIIRKMFYRTLIKNILLLGVFVSSAAIGDKHTVRMILESLIASVLIAGLFKTGMYLARVSSVLEDWRELFSEIDINNVSDIQIAKLIKGVLGYETALAWANIPLDSDIFDELNASLSKDWEEEKIRLKIV